MTGNKITCITSLQISTAVVEFFAIVSSIATSIWNSMAEAQEVRVDQTEIRHPAGNIFEQADDNTTTTMANYDKLDSLLEIVTDINDKFKVLQAEICKAAEDNNCPRWESTNQ